MYILNICYIYTSNRFNSHSIKLVTLKLYNYNSLKKLIIGKIKKHFIKYLNITALDTINTPIRICFIYILYITKLNLNQLTISKSVIVIYTR